MDEYTLQQELEALAGNAYNPDSRNAEAKHEPMSKTIKRWQHLSDLSSGEAVDRIMDHRNNLTRLRISEAHWDTIRLEKENEGYDREAYEYEINLQKKKTMLTSLVPADDSGVTYLVEMSGLLDNEEKVQRAAEMSEVPTVVSGRSLEDGRDVSLCCIDEPAKRAVLQWAAREGGGFEPIVLVNPRSLQ